jgi:hypothetical protein
MCFDESIRRQEFSAEIFSEGNPAWTKPEVLLNENLTKAES